MSKITNLREGMLRHLRLASSACPNEAAVNSFFVALFLRRDLADLDSRTVHEDRPEDREEARASAQQVRDAAGASIPAIPPLPASGPKFGGLYD